MTRPDATSTSLLAHSYAAHRQALCRYLVAKFRLGQDEAEDLVQATFVRVSDQASLASVDNARAFLYRAVHNAALDHLRRTKVRDDYARAQLDEQQDDAGEPAYAERAGDQGNPERLLIGRQLLELLARAMDLMPGKRRRLLLLHRLDGLSYAEIARRESLSVTVVKKHVAKALADCQRAVYQTSDQSSGNAS